MLNLSQTTGYAILGLSCLEKSNGHAVFAKDIAACTGIPLPYLSKILHSLTRSQLITSKRGFRGGFTLQRPADQISLFDVAEAVEHQDWLPRCLLGLADCPQEPACPTHKFWSKERERIERELRRVRLSHVSRYASHGDIAVRPCCGKSVDSVSAKAKVKQGAIAPCES